MRESLRRLRTDHLDCVLFHNIARDDRWPDLDRVLAKGGALDGLMEARKQGIRYQRQWKPAPNATSLRVIVHDVRGGQYGSLEVPLNKLPQ